MPIWCGVIGVALLALTCYDIIWTALSASTSGFLSIWIVRCFKWVRNYCSRTERMHYVLRAIGIFSFLSTIILWYFLLWCSWGFIFLVVEGSIVDTTTNAPASWVETFYYAGFTIFTLGNGDFRPNGTFFQLLTVLATGSGFIMVSVSVTYLYSASDAVIKMRQLAGYLSALGGTPDGIILNAWNGSSLENLNPYLKTISSDIIRCAQQMLRFPLIFNFHSIETTYSSAIRLAALDEVLTIVECCMEDVGGLNKLTFLYLRNAIMQYLMVLKTARLKNFEKLGEPPPPDLAKLRMNGLPILPAPRCHLQLNANDVKERRRLLYSLVKDSSWKWVDVLSAGK